MAFLEYNIYDNSLQTWLLAVFVTALAIAFLIGARYVLVQRFTRLAEKTTVHFAELVVKLLRQSKLFFFLFLALYIGALPLALPEEAASLVKNAVVIAFLIQAALWGDVLIAHLIAQFIKKRAEREAADVATVTVLGFIGRVAVWSIVVLLAMDNLGINISALLAGIGIGGIAAALAAQNMLGDLFASISIALDKPFVVGDFIIVDEHLGTVEFIGIKTTRVRSLSGEQLVFSNNDLLQSRIRNYKRMFERRVVFSIGVTYQTVYDKLANIPAMIREIIEAQDHSRFDRAHFSKYGDFALNFEMVYYVLKPDYNVYMDIQQAINLAIFRRFQEEGIEFAYPTQTLYLEKMAAA